MGYVVGLAKGEGPRRGGETIQQAIEISLYNGLVLNGTTTGYAHHFDEACPYTGGIAPDVVYKTTPDVTRAWNFDLCFSSYDTKIYIVIDGYGSEHGEYQLVADDWSGACVATCPSDPNAQLENEPSLHDGYVDNHNGSCGSHPDALFQTIGCPVFCGKSGWYLSAEGNNYRDTDWFLVEIPPGGMLEVIGDAEQPTYMFELGPQDCESVGVIQSVVVGPCAENTITIAGVTGSMVWLWVGPTTSAPTPATSPAGANRSDIDLRRLEQTPLHGATKR
jgi:hypothetical protein